MNVKKHYPPITAIFYLIIAIGIFLSIYQFVSDRSLRLDEAKLTLNIINKGFSELAQPLDANQVAPIGFLFVERIFVLIFGKNQMAVRTFPLISFLASIPLLYLLTNKLTSNHLITLLTTSIFSITLLLLRYSCEVKQYSIDVLFTITILYYSLTVQWYNNKSLFVYSIFGGIAIWFSNIAIIMLFVSGVYFFYFEYYRNKNYKVLLLCLFWAMIFLVYYYFFIYNHPSKQRMMEHWRNSFLPLNPFSIEFYSFLLGATANVYGVLLSFGPIWFIPALVSLIGIGFMLIRQNYRLLYFSLAPIIVHLSLSGLKLYPFSGRLILYITPLIILILSFAIYSLFEMINKKLFELSKFALVIPVVIMFYPVYLKFPVEKEQIKQSLGYIEKNIKPGETLYVYYEFHSTFSFYQETNVIDIKNRMVFDNSRKNNYFKFLQLTGKVWLLFSNLPDSLYRIEDKYMVKLLLDNGGELLDKKFYNGSSVYYIDTKKE